MGFVSPSLSLHVPVGAIALWTLLATTVPHARDQRHFEAEAPTWSEQHPAFAEKLEPESPQAPFFQS